MLELLLKDFPDHYKLIRKVGVENKSFDSNFSLTDLKSCVDCHNKTNYFYRQCMDQKVFSVSTNEKVDVINHEKYIQQYSDKSEIASGGCCDYLLSSTNKVAFVDLTCTRPSYIDGHRVGIEFREGKRSVAFKQLKDSIDRLSVCPTIYTHIQHCVKKDAILALRKKEFIFESEKSPETHMQSFMKMASEQSKYGIVQDMGNGFSFAVYEYPKVYIW